MNLDRLKTIKGAARETPFTENTYRWWIWNADENGFDRVIVRVGRRIYLDLDRLEEWVKGNSEVESAKTSG